MFPGGMGGGGSLALNQLLVVMDGIDNPPFFKKFFTNKTNTLLDGIYIVPRRIGRCRCGSRPRARARSRSTSSARPTSPSTGSIPRSRGPAAWAATSGSGRRRSRIASTSSTSTSARSRTRAELDQTHRREEIARVTNGYAPAMLEQVTSMALTIAHHSDREALTWDDLVEAMTTLEAGTAVGIEYIPEESRAVAIHEAGHAAAGHVYLKGAESTRLSIRMRGGALGHHQALEKEERFSRFRCEEFARLVWALGAMAAERVFYGENSNGVGGDVMSVTAQAAYMVGASAMGPEPFAGDAARGRDRGGSARAHPQALREDRPSDRQPHGRRRAVRARTRSPPSSSDSDKRAHRRPARRPGVRRRPQPRAREPRSGRAHRGRARRAP